MMSYQCIKDALLNSALKVEYKELPTKYGFIGCVSRYPSHPNYPVAKSPIEFCSTYKEGNQEEADSAREYHLHILSEALRLLEGTKP